MSEPYGSPLAILYLSDLLMGAAYSDSELDGKEVETVKQILGEVTGEELSATIEQRIDTFDPSTFSVDGTVRLLLKESEGLSESKEHKIKILEFIGTVHESDEEFAFEEDEYLREVAENLGLEAGDYDGLTLEVVSVEEIKPVIQSMAKPPPIPES